MSHDLIHGEESIVQEFLAPLAAGFPGAFGLKDDCAVIAPEPGHELVVKTDPIIAGLHFLAADSAEDVAWKALAVNVSDLAAKGARPLAYLMALALPEAPERTWMERFAGGLREAQETFGCRLIGGDTDRTPGPLTVSITAFGTVPEGRMVRRGTARPGDHLLVTGNLGDAALGLQLLKQPKRGRELGLDEGEMRALVRRFHRPQPRLALASLLREYASAAMDLSDGLAKDCGRMCAASGVAAHIEISRLPLSASLAKALQADAKVLELVLAGGDDYEILLTVPEAQMAPFRAGADCLDLAVSHIGEIVEGEGVTFLARDGRALEVGRSGWDHFA